MKYDKVFLDASFVIALLNKKDKHHTQAKDIFNSLLNTREVWTTELILCEIGNALSHGNKQNVINFLENCYKTENIKVIHSDEFLIKKAIDIYKKYKVWFK